MSYVPVATMLVGTHWSLCTCTGVFGNSVILVILMMFGWIEFPVCHEYFTEMAPVLKCLSLVNGK
jgi:hypothetical protein